MAWMLIKKLGDQPLHIPHQYDHVDAAGEFTVFEQKTARFADDHIFEVAGDHGIVLDGVVLNKSELLASQGGTAWPALVASLEAPICRLLRGPFTGCLWEGDCLYTFANQTGDTAVFYYQNAICFVASSSFSMVCRFCRENCFPLTYDEVASKQLMTLGWAVEGHTLAEEIHRVRPGEVVYLESGKIREEIYHRLDNTHPLDITMEQAIELVDDGFRKAVKRCFDKDLEYGYTNHLADMSGGLDSRMTSWVARDLGYENITNICYAKSDSNEMPCARAAAMALGNEFLFKPMDDLTFFYDVDEILQKNYGLATYIGLTGGNRFLSDLSFEKFGLEHSGQIGDVVIGSFVHDLSEQERNVTVISSSDLLPSTLEQAENFPNHEIFCMYYRCFYGTVSSHFIRSHYTYTVSPFLDIDFLKLCLSIPVAYRCNHVLYLAWLRAKYPAALTVPSTRRTTDHQKPTWRDMGRKLVGKNKRAVIRVLKKLNMYGVIDNPNSMNPLEYWYSTTPNLQAFLSAYYEENLFRLDAHPAIKPQVEQLFYGERVADKLLAITVLGGLKNYFGTEQA